MTQAAAVSGIGHNNPPSDIDIFGEKVMQKYPGIFDKAKNILEAEERAPKEVNDDETSGRVGDFIKQVQAAIKNLEAARKAEKEEYVAAGRRVDGFFKVRWIDKLELMKINLSAINAAYLKRKEDEERRKREEEAERLRAEQEEKLREAERLRKEAEDKLAEAEAERKRQEEEAAHREREIREEAERKRKEAQDEIDRLKKEAEDKKAAQEKIDAETREQLRQAQEKLKEVSREEKAELKELKADVFSAEAEVSALEKQAQQQVKESNKIEDSAKRIEKQAEKMEKLADSSAADLARTRGVEGSLSTIRTEWVGTLTDRTQLDLEALRHHFRESDLQFAIDQWVKANKGSTLRGTYCREETTAQTR